MIHVRFNMERLVKAAADSFSERLESLGFDDDDIALAGVRCAGQFSDECESLLARVARECEDAARGGTTDSQSLQGIGQAVFSDAGRRAADRFYNTRYLEAN